MRVPIGTLSLTLSLEPAARREGREAGGGGGASLSNRLEADLACALFSGARRLPLPARAARPAPSAAFRRAPLGRCVLADVPQVAPRRAMQLWAACRAAGASASGIRPLPCLGRRWADACHRRSWPPPVFVVSLHWDVPHAARQASCRRTARRWARWRCCRRTRRRWRRWSAPSAPRTAPPRWPPSSSAPSTASRRGARRRARPARPAQPADCLARVGQRLRGA
jgi:hypothetical protein